MKRRGDWHSRLNTFIDDVKRKPFAWDHHDCFCGWAAAAVLAMTGEDIGAPYRGKYTTARGAASVMKRAGFDNLGDGLASLLPEIHVSRARLGDLVAIPDDSRFGFTLGIVNGEMILVLGEKAMGVVPMTKTMRAFAVG
jgi:hypothetical protein